MGRGSGGASSKLKKVAMKLFHRPCGFFLHKQQIHVPHNSTVTYDLSNHSSPPENLKSNISPEKISSEIAIQINPNKNLCTICLDPLNYSSGTNSGQPIFTAQCSHAFHFVCISSNVRHGSLTCPICRAHWTQLPRNLNTYCSLHNNKTDPVLQILDASIADSRVHRHSVLRSARYDDDDPIEELDHTTDQPRIHLSILPSSSSFENRAYLNVKLAPQLAIDLVLVASTNGPHLRLMKQAMALVIFSLRHMDRLSIVTYSSAAARVFSLRRMTSNGKRTALQIIDRLFYVGHADPMEGLTKGVKVLGDRVHKNPQSCILHLTDHPVRSYHQFQMEVPATIYWFNVAFGFGASNGFIMREFEEFLAGTLWGAIRDLQLRTSDRTDIIRIGDLRSDEERNIPLYTGDSRHVCVEYSYIDGGECIRTGEIVLEVEKNGEGNESKDVVPVGGRISSAENWDYHDTFMARRWAKHLHGYRL